MMSPPSKVKGSKTLCLLSRGTWFYGLPPPCPLLPSCLSEAASQVRVLYSRACQYPRQCPALGTPPCHLIASLSSLPALRMPRKTHGCGSRHLLRLRAWESSARVGASTDGLGKGRTTEQSAEAIRVGRALEGVCRKDRQGPA